MNGPLINSEGAVMPPFVTYALKNVRSLVGHGVTEPEFGEVSAVIKQDNDESRAQVYSEYVGSRLAALLCIPTAAGVFVTHSRGLRYASLMIAEVGFSLTEIDSPHAEEVALRYPVESAKLAVFDVWIGNIDRAGNIRANLGESTDNLIVGIDHGGCLLYCADDIDSSLDRLLNKQWPPIHIFHGYVRDYLVQPIVERIMRLSDESIQEACMV